MTKKYYIDLKHLQFWHTFFNLPEMGGKEKWAYLKCKSAYKAKKEGKKKFHTFYTKIKNV